MRALIFAVLMILSQGTAFAQLPADPCDFSIGTPTPLHPTVQAFRDVLQNRCASCHGAGAGVTPVNPNVMSYKENVRLGWIVPGDPAKSRIHVRTDAGTMPPSGKLPVGDLKVIFEYLRDHGGEDWDETPAPLPANYISPIQERACMLKHARAADKAKRNDSKNYRYLLFTNVHNTGNVSAFQNLVWGATLVVNSIAVDIGKALAAGSEYSLETGRKHNLDDTGIIRAIYLPAIVKDAKTFDGIFLANDPYRIDFTKGNIYDRTTRDEIQDLEDELFDLTGQRVPAIRADLFNKLGGLDFYYESVGIDPTKQKLDDIRKTLGVNQQQAIQDQEVDQILIENSGVAPNNRAIQRYDSLYTLGGNFTRTSYWETFDFIDELNFSHVFSNPFGPAGVIFDFNGDGKNDTNKIFVPFAGEAIGSLPNRFMLFLVADANGNLLRAADTRVAYNPSRLHPAFDKGRTPGVIVAGVGGCIECHSIGMPTAVDKGYDFLRRNPGLAAAELNFLNEIMPPQDELDEQFATFNAAYQQVHQRVIGSPTALVSASEPLTLSLEKHLGYQTIADAAAEFGLTEDGFRTCVELEEDIAIIIGLKEGRISRDKLDDQFDEIAEACGVGQVVPFVPGKGGGGAVKPPPGKKDCVYDWKNGSSYRLSFVADYGVRGAFSTVLFPGEATSNLFLKSDNVDGVIRDFKYSARGAHGWGSDVALGGTHNVTGCRPYEFFDDKARGRPGIR